MILYINENKKKKKMFIILNVLPKALKYIVVNDKIFLKKGGTHTDNQNTQATKEKMHKWRKGYDIQGVNTENDRERNRTAVKMHLYLSFRIPSISGRATFG